MLYRAEDFLGRVTFVTGPEKHCGKTTFMNHAARLVRREAERSGLPGPALLTVGYDGESRDFLSGARKPAVPVGSGDVIVTTARFARPCSPEILEVLPGSTALGRLCVVRAKRSATVALVGPEGNSLVAWAAGRIVEAGYSSAVLVDGAINRITQVAALPGTRFVYALRVDQASAVRAIARIRRMASLLALPAWQGETPVTRWDSSLQGRKEADHTGFLVEGALTSESSARVPQEAKRLIVEDCTKVFLSDGELAAFLRDRTLYVRRRLEFSGFVVVCRGLSDEAFLGRLGDDELASLIAFNPYEEGRAA